jgi:hypothetical protein
MSPWQGSGRRFEPASAHRKGPSQLRIALHDAQGAIEGDDGPCNCVRVLTPNAALWLERRASF